MSIEDVRANLRAKAGKSPSRGMAQREPVTSIAKVVSDRSRQNSRAKGNRGELDVAKLFSKWCGETVRRTPGSGGWGGSKDFDTTADLVCANKAWPFHVECKHRELWVLDDLVTGTRREHDKSIVQWWKQCVTSCPRKKNKIADKYTQVVLAKVPLLVFRRNRQPWLVMIAVDDLYVSAGTWTPPAIFRVPVAGFEDVAVMLLSEFLDIVSVPSGMKNHVGSL